ncbi:OmpA family protein [Pseudodesulfovibrio sp. JC047]|uniref:OmpA family protein n=1 Tax=Pseudodesulfovibrio sp. JC047 TaxID=2683199 RepID=UPI0013CF6B4C|nr:OmpA family protein [Pseudodesulfovibrio sp. JC047]NDV20173.1 OmpA family protein [Pseudodesulfovibrio sp. JC047]
MQEIEKTFATDFSSFSQMDSETSMRGVNDWAVPWADLMMVMFVLFVVLFMYASTHQDVKILFSPQAAEKAQASSSFDPLIGLIGQIASRATPGGSQNQVRVGETEVLFRSRSKGISVVRDAPGRVRISLRGALFFDAQSGLLKPASSQYLNELAEVVKLSFGTVHVVGFADKSESVGTQSFQLSSQRATSVADFLITQFGIVPERVVVTGRGAYQPEVPDTSEANKIQNRRVEIVIAQQR